MKRPLIVCDCDEVLLHMVRHFRDWLDAEHDIAFTLKGNPFMQSMKRRGDTEPMTEDDVWRLLGGFFDTQMDSQVPIEGAVDAVASIQEKADFVILTNLQDARNAARKAQLEQVGINAPVYTNQGPKGGTLKQIAKERDASHVVFIDDIASHHASALEHLPRSSRLQFCGEPAVAPHIPCALDAGHASARIDNWDEALPWVLSTIEMEQDRAD